MFAFENPQKTQEEILAEKEQEEYELHLCKTLIYVIAMNRKFEKRHSIPSVLWPRCYSG
jgi:hypothetical protein